MEGWGIGNLRMHLGLSMPGDFFIFHLALLLPHTAVSGGFPSVSLFDLSKEMNLLQNASLSDHQKRWECLWLWYSGDEMRLEITCIWSCARFLQPWTFRWWQVVMLGGRWLRRRSGEPWVKQLLDRCMYSSIFHAERGSKGLMLWWTALKIFPKTRTSGSLNGYWCLTGKDGN